MKKNELEKAKEDFYSRLEILNDDIKEHFEEDKYSALKDKLEAELNWDIDYNNNYGFHCSACGDNDDREYPQVDIRWDDELSIEKNEEELEKLEELIEEYK